MSCDVGTIEVRSHFDPDHPDSAERTTFEVVRADDYAEVTLQLWQAALDGQLRGMEVHRGGTILVIGTRPWGRVVYRYRGQTDQRTVLVERMA